MLSMYLVLFHPRFCSLLFSSVLVSVSKAEEQPPALQTLSLQGHCQQGRVNTVPMLSPILFLTTKFYYCNILILLHQELNFKMKPQLFISLMSPFKARLDEALGDLI